MWTAKPAGITCQPPPLPLLHASSTERLRGRSSGDTEADVLMLMRFGGGGCMLSRLYHTMPPAARSSPTSFFVGIICTPHTSQPPRVASSEPPLRHACAVAQTTAPVCQT